ncbi:glutamate-rich protein 3-like [Athene cunicularia]|uniref:glutamate-rich protein 3-like n=1 Tax=Athene cunicularia TaxID=194338 RepID=UPI000EF6BAC7|nr:glutamate-rich protein 3-like [Athene cunicularia]
MTNVSSIINTGLIPTPPPPQQKSGKTVRTGVTRGRQLRPITVPSGAEVPPRMNSGVAFRSLVRSGPCITMAFLGRNLHLFGKDADNRSEIRVYQQHCGGENLCVYKGNLLEGETFQFISRRHKGFPFSLTFILNGLPVDRLSCCCEYRHRRPSTVGGRHGYFRFVSVEGASPCYRYGDKCALLARTSQPSCLSLSLGSSFVIFLAPCSSSSAPSGAVAGGATLTPLACLS